MLAPLLPSFLVMLFELQRGALLAVVARLSSPPLAALVHLLLYENSHPLWTFLLSRLVLDWVQSTLPYGDILPSLDLSVFLPLVHACAHAAFIKVRPSCKDQANRGVGQAVPRPPHTARFSISPPCP